ncbi:hypothetical protein OAF74_01760 [bacterium]|jgi:hypothetical protein|nr:hypothetical protein [Planctomicrobium sp.]MDB4731542.1 hypothetical protein [bacterium]
MSNDRKPYSKFRGFVIYIVSCFLFWGCLASMIAPTDVAPPGAPPVSVYLIVIQVILCYGLPCLFVYWDFRTHRPDR